MTPGLCRIAAMTLLYVRHMLLLPLLALAFFAAAIYLLALPPAVAALQDHFPGPAHLYFQRVPFYSPAPLFSPPGALWFV